MDDHAEVWVDGPLPRLPGQSGGARHASESGRLAKPDWFKEVSGPVLYYVVKVQ